MKKEIKGYEFTCNECGETSTRPDGSPPFSWFTVIEEINVAGGRPKHHFCASTCLYFYYAELNGGRWV